MMNFVFKKRNFVLKMMNFAAHLPWEPDLPTDRWDPRLFRWRRWSVLCVAWAVHEDAVLAVGVWDDYNVQPGEPFLEPFLDRSSAGMFYWAVSWPLNPWQVYYGSVKDNPLTFSYSIYVGLWSISFLEAWHRRENELRFTWGTQDLSSIEVSFQHSRIRISYFSESWFPIEESWFPIEKCWIPNMHNDFE